MTPDAQNLSWKRWVFSLTHVIYKGGEDGGPDKVEEYIWDTRWSRL